MLGAGETRAAQTCEQALLEAVLDAALMALRAGTKPSARLKARREAARVREWVNSDDCGATYGGFTFVFVCAHLGLSPEYLRAELPHVIEEPARRVRNVTGRLMRANGGY